MRGLLITTLILTLAKIYTGSLLTKAQTENAQVQAFVDYDFNSGRLESSVYGLIETVLDLAKTKSSWFQATGQLIDTNEKLKTAPLDDLVKAFNEADLKDAFDYPDIVYEENKGLTYEHNRLLLLANGYEEIFKKMSEKSYGNALLERPYLLDLRRDGDSMEVDLVYALTGPVNNFSLVYQGDTIILDSLPVNIGPVKGLVKLGITDEVTGEQKWYSKEF